MVRLLPKDRKLRRWVIIILIITFILVASLMIYSVLASTKHKPGNNEIELKVEKGQINI